VTDPLVVDARGLRCPLPVIRLAQAVEGLPDGVVVVVLATDPAAAHDVPAWARMRGHTWLGSERAEDDDCALRLSVLLGPPTGDTPKTASH
jgi:tRNA 2-thiouridine synthesizing protein A